MTEWVAVFEITVTKRIAVKIDISDKEDRYKYARERAEELLNQRENGVRDVPFSNFQEVEVYSEPVLENVYRMDRDQLDGPKPKDLKDWLIPP